MGVYRRFYPRHTSKELISKFLKYFKICQLILPLFHFGWNTEVVHSKQLGRIARMTSFFARGSEGMDNTD